MINQMSMTEKKMIKKFLYRIIAPDMSKNVFHHVSELTSSQQVTTSSQQVTAPSQQVTAPSPQPPVH